MIKLNRIFTPICLNPDFVRDGTNKFKLNKEARVWNNPNLKQALMNLSEDKCAYCECYLSKEANYMEVEHFIDKDSNADLVLYWDNLLPSCKRCNVAKGTHDVCVEPIIDPCVDDPRVHLRFHMFGRMRPKTDVGRSTIEVVGLNNMNRAVQPRFKIATAIGGFVDDCLVLVERYIANPTTRSKNRLKNKVEFLLKECLPDAEYSATAASALHHDPDYIQLKHYLVENKLWHAEFDEMDRRSSVLVFDIAS